MLEFPKLALKNLEFVDLSFHINFCMHNYGINDVSERINFASKHANIASVNVVSHKYGIMRQLLTSLLGAAIMQ